MDRFEVVRRALAVERTDGDKTPYLREIRKGSPVQFDESTWERVVEQDLTGKNW
jgi:hypothetical protein